MNGVLITMACIIVGTLLATQDVIAGLAVIVIGGGAGLIMAWQELS